MDATTHSPIARAVLDEQAHRMATLVGSLPQSTTPIPGSTWTIREVALHLGIGMGLYGELATGTPSPIASLLDKDPLAALNAALFADVPETDPGKLALLMLDGLQRFLDATAGRPGDQEILWHCGTRLDLASLVSIALGEYLIHGYDVATSVGRPWPINPEHARLALHGYPPLYSLILNPRTSTGLTASYRIELRGGDGFTVRFTDGAFRLDPTESGPVDCTISADPVAFLLVITGRLTSAVPTALGLWSIEGSKPELALGFPQLFIFP